MSSDVTSSWEESVRAQLERILASSEFAASERMRRFLRFVVEAELDGKGDSIKETVIGAIAFDRDPSYDPKIEPIVRVEARRLRRKLEAYYGEAGVSDPVRIELPAGGYTPKFTRHSSVPPVRSIAKRSSRWLALVLIPIGCAGYLAYHFSRQRPHLVSLENYRIERMTDFGSVIDASLSADGKYLAYVRRDSGRFSLWLRQTASTATIRVAGPSELRYDFTQFTPDGNFLYFLQGSRSGQAALMTVSSLGGEVRQAGGGRVIGRVSFSPDGQRFAVLGQVDKGMAVVVVRADGGGEHVIATKAQPESYGAVSWSPRGDVIASLVFRPQEPHSLIEFLTPDGARKSELPAGAWRAAKRMEWMPGGEGLIVSAGEMPSESQVWSVTYRGGETHLLTHEVSNYVLGVAAKAGTLAGVRSQIHASLWVASAANPDDAQRIFDGPGARDGYKGLAWTRDGRLVFSRAMPVDSLWISGAKGDGARPLIADGRTVTNPVLAGDGNWILYQSYAGESGAPQIWALPLSGGRSRQLTREQSAEGASSSPDGRWFVYVAHAGDRMIVKKLPWNGGLPAEIFSAARIRLLRLSPDGKWIGVVANEHAGDPPGLAVLPADGGAPKFLPLPLDMSKQGNPEQFAWTPDSRAIVFPVAGEGADNLWRQPVDGSTPRQITHFRSERIYAVDLSPDSKRIAVSRGRAESDVVLFKPR